MNVNLMTTYLVILILLSGLFSATETAYSSLNKIKLKNLANNGNQKAEKTLKLADNYSQLISTILVGNNLVNIIATSIATILFVDLLGQDMGVTISTVVMTVAVLIFGEVTPKNIAKENAEAYAMFVYPVISFLVYILKPINFLFEAWTTLLRKIFKFQGEDSISSEELKTIVQEASDDGELEEHESDLIQNAIEFGESVVKEIYTPRVDVIALDITTSNEEIEKVFRENGYSRLPVFENSVDNIVGVLNDKDFYYLNYAKTNTSIRKIIKPVFYTTGSVLIADLLRQLQAAKIHMAIVLDEFGGTAGICTMEDILEELVGEIYDEHDEVVEFFTKLDENEYIVKCDIEVDEFFEYFGLKEDNSIDVVTVSGWLISEMKRIPKVNDVFRYRNLEFTVIETNSKRILEVEVVILDEQTEK